MTLLRNLLFFGLLIWVSSCMPESQPESTAEDVAPDVSGNGDVYTIMPDKSGIEWTGAKLTTKHKGTLDIAEGKVWVKDGVLTGGRFMLDMNSIYVLDLEGKDREDLETHLKDTDFFETDKHPTGKFVIVSVKEMEDEVFTHEISGNLTLKGITHRVHMPAVIRIDQEGLVANASLSIDRSRWGIVYKGRLDNAIRDEVYISLMIQGKLLK